MASQSNRPISAPIVATGAPRSGKTIIAWILAGARGVTYVSEPLSIWALGSHLRSDDRRFADEATPEVAQRIRDLCAREVAKAGGERYIDDFAYHSLRLEFLRAVLPDVRIIHVVQDGRVAVPQMVYGWTFTEPFYETIKRRWRGISLRTAVTTLPRLARRWLSNHWASKVEGRRRAWGPQPPGLAEFARTHADPAEVAAFQWRTLIEVALEDLAHMPPDQAITIRFEDLLEDPQGVATRLARFCGIDDVEGVQQAARDIINPDAPTEHVELTAEQWKRVAEIIEPLRVRLGYTSRLPFVA